MPSDPDDAVDGIHMPISESTADMLIALLGVGDPGPLTAALEPPAERQENIAIGNIVKEASYNIVAGQALDECGGASEDTVNSDCFKETLASAEVVTKVESATVRECAEGAGLDGGAIREWQSTGRVKSESAVAGWLNCTIENSEREALGDRILVTAHDRNGVAVSSYYRGRPSGNTPGDIIQRTTGPRPEEKVTIEDTIGPDAGRVTEEDFETHPFSRSRLLNVSGQEATMKNVVAPIDNEGVQVFGQHAAEAPPHMLTAVRFPELVRLDERTPDGRLINAAGFAIRDLPLSFSALFTTQHGDPGQAVIVGALDEVTITGNVVSGRGWLLDEPDARRAGRLIQSGSLTGNSVELAASKVEMDFNEDEDMEIDFLEAKLAATTLVAVPAMEGATVELLEPEFDFGEVVTASTSFANDQPMVSFSLALAEPEADRPPASWFRWSGDIENLYPIRVEEDGQVHGYLAAWETRHLDARIPPPKSKSNYAYFANKEVLTDAGFVATGQLVLGGEHAGLDVGWQDAVDFYASTSEAWADVAIGEDDLGIWVAGMVRPGTSSEKIHAGRASALSGDWRRIGNGLELIAALSVNSPGFPIPRPSAFADRGRQTSMVGAGVVPQAKPKGDIFQTIAERDLLSNLEATARHARRMEAERATKQLRAERQKQLRRDIMQLTKGL